MQLPYYITWTKQKDVNTFPIKKVDNATIWTDENCDLIDMSSISYQAHFGHKNPTIVKALHEQLDSVPMSSPKGEYAHKRSTTHKLLDFLNLDHGKIFYTTGGAETIENALKIARQITKKKIVLARSNSYHGATMGALSVTGDWRNPPHMLPNDWVVRIPEPTEKNALVKTSEIIKKIGPRNIAAVIIETITGGNGVIIPSKEWIEGINLLCKENNIIFILDEVICGFYRTGTPFGFNHFHLTPDMVCLAKGITGGMIPFGALWTSKKISEYYQEEILCCGLTNYAHPMGMAALKAVLEIVNSGHFKKELKQMIILFHQSLDEIAKLPIVNEVRKIGMLSAIDLKKSIDWKIFYQAGLYLVAQNKRIIVAPPLTISSAELKTGIDRIKNVLGNNYEQ